MLAAPDPVLWVDGDAVAGNLALVRERLGGRRLFAVLKDNAYGHGMLPMARALADAGVDAFAVGSPEEAFALRASGIAGEILSLRLFAAADARRLVGDGIVQAVFTEEQAALLASAARDAGRRARVHVKVDTGLRRFGIAPAEAAPFVDRIRRDRDLSLEGVFTVLSEVADLDGPRRTVFGALRELVGVRDGEAWHLAASHGLLHDPRDRDDAVRVGCLLCGFPPSGENVEGIRPVARLSAPILGIANLEAGDRVGFGGRWRVERDTRAAWVGIGVRHGLPERFREAGEVLIGGRRVRVRQVGAEYALAELSPDVVVHGPGDPAVLLGDQGEESIGLDELAVAFGTSPYTALQSLRSRVRRSLVGGPGGPSAYS